METYNFPPFPTKGERRLFMPSNFTEHYNLNQWEPDDRVLRTDFNADNTKIDAALAGKMGKLELIRGTGPYTGKCMSDNAMTGDIKWGDYEFVLYTAEVHPEDLGDATSIVVRTYENPTTLITLPNESFVLVFYVGHNSSNPIRGFALSSAPGLFLARDFTYETFLSLIFRAPTGYISGMDTKFYGIR